MLNDSIFERTAWIEDKYNVKIKQLYCGNTSAALSGSQMSQFIGKSVLSGEKAFDAILTSPYDTAGYMQSKYIVDLNSLENLDLTKPWWDQNANKDLSIGDKIYFTTGELTYVDNMATHCLIFNKSVASELKIDDPYQTVRDGIWTLDKMIANSKLALNDLNGDGAYDENDRFGFTYWQDACFSFIVSTGNSFGAIDSNGSLELTFYSEKMINTWDKLISFLGDDSTFALKNELKVYSGMELGVINKNMLDGGNMLCNFECIGDVIKLRDASGDFGILPYPKYDEAQENYITSPHAYGCAMLSVPVTTDNTARTGFILEAFCAKSMEVVTPAFYDKTLNGKIIRDDESAEMLEIIYSTRHYDIGYFLMWGDLTNKVMNMWNSKDANLASMFASVKETALTDMARSEELFSSIN